MRGRAIFLGFLLSFLGVTFIGVGIGSSMCDSGPGCEGADAVLIPFLATGAALLGTVVLLNVIWARRRAADARIRRDGIRVPARMLRSETVGSTQNNGQTHQKTTWQALLPDGSTREWMVRTTARFDEGALLEAACLDGECALMLLVNHKSVVNDGEARRESSRRAGELLPAGGPEGFNRDRLRATPPIERSQLLIRHL